METTQPYPERSRNLAVCEIVGDHTMESFDELDEEAFKEFDEETLGHIKMKIWELLKKASSNPPSLAQGYPLMTTHANQAHLVSSMGDYLTREWLRGRISVRWQVARKTRNNEADEPPNTPRTRTQKTFERMIEEAESKTTEKVTVETSEEMTKTTTTTERITVDMMEMTLETMKETIIEETVRGKPKETTNRTTEKMIKEMPETDETGAVRQILDYLVDDAFKQFEEEKLFESNKFDPEKHGKITEWSGRIWSTE